MKTFSELLAIDVELAVSIKLKIHGRVEYSADINEHTFQDETKITLCLLSDIDFAIQLHDFDEGTSGIEIIKFTVNELEVLPRYQYHAERHTNFVDQLGTWKLHIPKPFYQWYHTITGQGWLLKPV